MCSENKVLIIYGHSKAKMCKDERSLTSPTDTNTPLRSDGSYHSPENSKRSKNSMVIDLWHCRSLQLTPLDGTGLDFSEIPDRTARDPLGTHKRMAKTPFTLVIFKKIVNGYFYSCP